MGKFSMPGEEELEKFVVYCGVQPMKNYLYMFSEDFSGTQTIGSARKEGRVSRAAPPFLLIFTQEELIIKQIPDYITGLTPDNYAEGIIRIPSNEIMNLSSVEYNFRRYLSFDYHGQHFNYSTPIVGGKAMEFSSDNYEYLLERSFYGLLTPENEKGGMDELTRKGNILQFIPTFTILYFLTFLPGLHVLGFSSVSFCLAGFLALGAVLLSLAVGKDSKKWTQKDRALQVLCITMDAVSICLYLASMS